LCRSISCMFGMSFGFLSRRFVICVEVSRVSVCSRLISVVIMFCAMIVGMVLPKL